MLMFNVSFSISLLKSEDHLSLEIFDFIHEDLLLVLNQASGS